MEDRQRPTAHSPATTDHGQNPQAPRDLTTGKLAPTPRLLAPSSPPAPRILRKGGRPAANEEQKGRNAARKGHAWAASPVPTASASVCRVARNRTSSPRTSARACPRRERNCQQGENRECKGLSQVRRKGLQRSLVRDNTITWRTGSDRRLTARRPPITGKTRRHLAT